MSKPMLLTLDLQLFAGEEFGGYDPSTAYDGIQMPQGEPQVQPQGQGEVFQQQQMEPELLDFGGRKLAANDELMGLHKDYTEQQRYITALQEQVNAYKQLAQQVQPQGQPQAQAQPQEISMNTENWDEETWAEFYDKPNNIIGKIIEQSLSRFAAEKLDPIIQEREWNNEIQRMYDQFPDFNDHIGEIQALVNQYPDQYAAQGGLEQAYYRAVAEKARAMNPAQLAQDPNFLNQYVLNNPNVQTQMMNQYFQQKQQTNQQIPVTMGRGAGGFTPQTPDSSPTTLREASRAFLKNLGVR